MDLAGTEKPVVVFAHQRLDREPADSHTVKQAPEVRKILEMSGKVKAVFQGHSHENDLRTVAGIPYCTLKAVGEVSPIGAREFFGQRVVPAHRPGCLCWACIDPGFLPGLLSWTLPGKKGCRLRGAFISH